MSFGKRLTEARKLKNLSQTDLADYLGTKAPVIGRYERDEMRPSIEVAAKLATLLEVSLDYLTGQTNIQMDQDTLNRIREVSSFAKEDQEHVYSVIDAFIAKKKIQTLMATK